MKVSRHTDGLRSRRRTRSGSSHKSPRRVRPRIDLLESRQLLAGTWLPVTDTSGASLPAIEHTILLSDGSVLAQTGRNQATNTWIRLTMTGQVARVTVVPNSNVQRLFYTSDVLTDGRVLVLGGEYSGPNTDLNDNNTGEIYDPVHNTWSAIASFPEGQLGDAPSEVLSDGTVLVGSITDSKTFIYHPSTNSWTQGPSLLSGDTSSEEGWAKLPDGSILSYSIGGGAPQTAERYVPSLNQWVFAGSVPVPLATKAGNDDLGAPELGPAIQLPDGKIFWVGATNHTALYTPPTTAAGIGSWAAGPDIPGGAGAFDAPIALEPNGLVLFGAQALDGTFAQAAQYFEYDPTGNNISMNPGPAPNIARDASFLNRFLVLPDGDVFQVDGPAAYVYREDPAVVTKAAWAPTITSASASIVGQFTLTGTQFNGISEGSGYGDDAENASNFPLVRFTDSQGGTSFGRTFNWTSTAVATGSTPVSTDFSPPSKVFSSPGVYQLQVVANGLASRPDLFVQTGSNQGVTLQTDPADGYYQVLFDGVSVGEYAPGSFSGVVLSLSASTLNVIIRETQSGSPVTVVGNPYFRDTVTIGDGSGVQGILGAVVVDNPGNYNTLNVSDAGDAGGRFVTIATSADVAGSPVGVITGLAPATITYKLADTASPISITGGSAGNIFTISGGADNQTIELNSGVGDDTVNVAYDLAPLNIDGGGGRDQIDIGSGAAAGINGAIHVADTGGAASVLVDDHLDTVGETVTVNDGSLTGLSPAAITWTATATGSGGVTGLHVLGGQGSDAWNVVNTSNFGPIVGGGFTWLQTGNGSNSLPNVNVQATKGGLHVNGGSAGQTVVLGSTGTLQNVHGFVSVYNSSPSGYSILAVNDSADAVKHTVGISDGLITGLAPAPLYWTDSAAGTYRGGVAALRLYGGTGGDTWDVANDGATFYGTTLQTTAGTNQVDAVNVQTTTSPLTIDGGGDAVTVTVGSLAPSLGGTLAGIKGDLTVENAAGLSGKTTLILDDGGDAQARAATLLDGSLTGLSPASIRWIDYNSAGLGEGGVDTVKVLGGAGAGTWTVSDGGASSVTATLNTGGGNDAVNVRASAGFLYVVNPGGNDSVAVGGAAPGAGGDLAGIHGGIDVLGAGGTKLSIDDSADGSPRTVTLDDDGLGDASLAGLAPSPIYWVDANGATGGVTGVRVYAGIGGNTINVLNTSIRSVSTDLYPGGGADLVTITGASGPLSLHGGGPGSRYHLVVSTTADGAAAPAGKLSLRRAVSLADGVGTAASPALITFDPTAFAAPQTIALTGGELLLNGTVTLAGPVGTSGAPLVTINGRNAARVFDVQGGPSGVDVTLRNLVVTGGQAGPAAANAPGSGGGLLVNDAGGYVSLDTISLKGNKAQATAAGATARGGGLAVLGGSLRLTNSTVSGNTATGPNAQGGGIFLGGASAQLDDDTIAANAAQGSGAGVGQGGGLALVGGSLAVTYGTFSGDRAAGGTAQGGGLFLRPGLRADLVDSLFAGNAATAGPDVAGVVSVSDHNLVGNAAGSSGFSTATGDLLNVNPNLSPLGNYGGPTPTSPPQPGGPAIDAGDGFGLAPPSFPGLVAEWRADGSAAYGAGADPSTSQGAVSYVPGVFGRAFQLDGATGYIQTTPNPADLSINSKITVSAWVNPTIYKYDNVIIDKTQFGDFANYRFGIHGGQLFFYNGATAALSAGTVPLQTFTQVAFTLDAATNTLKFYINGALDSTRSIGLGFPNTAAARVGRDIQGRSFQGKLDEVQVYNTNLDATQVQALFRAGTQASPVLLDSWKAEGDALDAGGTSNGVITGDVSYAPGASGQAFSFGDGGGNVDLGTGADVTGVGAFAVGAWIKTSSDGVVINQRDMNNYNGEYVLSVGGGKIVWNTFGGMAGFNVVSNRSVADGRWHYVLAQRLPDGTGQVFIDGFLDNSQAAPPVPLGSGFHVYLGEDVRNALLVSAPNAFRGRIDEVQIYGGALTPAQVQLLSNAPAGLARDQQGGARPVGGLPDVGAVEYQYGAPSGVDIEVQPRDGATHQVLAPIVVWVVDANGHAVIDSDQLVTISIAAGPAGAKLRGTVAVRAVHGVATFSGLSFDRAGTYTLRAVGGSLDPDVSDSFTIVAARGRSHGAISTGPRVAAPLPWLQAGTILDRTGPRSHKYAGGSQSRLAIPRHELMPRGTYLGRAVLELSRRFAGQRRQPRPLAPATLQAFTARDPAGGPGRARRPLDVMGWGATFHEPLAGSLHLASSREDVSGMRRSATPADS